MEYVLGGAVYRDEVSAMHRCRAILAGRERLDRAFVGDVFRLHPRRAEKSGCGVRRYFVAPSAKGAMSFWVERTDGTSVKWSYKKCF